MQWQESQGFEASLSANIEFSRNFYLAKMAAFRPVGSI